MCSKDRINGLHNVSNLFSPQTQFLFVRFVSAAPAVKVLASDTVVLAVGRTLATTLGLESVASPDQEVRYSGGVNNAVFYPSARTELRIRICHL